MFYFWGGNSSLVVVYSKFLSSRLPQSSRWRSPSFIYSSIQEKWELIWDEKQTVISSIRSNMIIPGVILVVDELVGVIKLIN